MEINLASVISTGKPSFGYYNRKSRIERSLYKYNTTSILQNVVVGIILLYEQNSGNETEE